MFKVKTLLILAIIVGFQATQASAASVSKTQSFTLTVTIPASVVMPHDIRPAIAPVEAEVRKPQIVQEQQTVRNNTPVTLQSTVIL